jgi:hypothetical protein
VHGKAMSFTMTDWGRRADALVQFTAPPERHFAGPLGAAGSRAPIPGWWADLDETQPVVHVTQGTIANIDYGQAIAPTLRALAEEDVLVVVTTGGRPLDTLPTLRANARAATYLPYDELLPRTAVYVTNGGYGGVQYALRYGVPIVVTGGKEDKRRSVPESRGPASDGGSEVSTRRRARCAATSSPCSISPGTAKPVDASRPT